MEYGILPLIIVALLGAIIGSFLNVVILRLPEENSSIAYPASHCPKCNHPLSWYENIPLLSFLILGGKCRSCKEHISWQYPLIEASMALLGLGLFLHFGLTLTFLAYFCFSAALLVIIVIDFYHQIIPDLISLPGIALGFLFSFINPEISWLSSLIGLLVGGGALYAIAWGYFTLRKQEGMGGGDIKLLAMLGAWLGWQSLVFIVFTSSLFGAIIGLIALRIQNKGNQTKIPFGPFLCLAALVYLFYSVEIQYFFQLYLNGQWP
ncbi:prepilin peptidase [Desulfotalea psychrophila]|uniref:Prepilin leader peptidase/N-methyltransferase n=1 Tax=Desulfotalea psychrophila (strain LSv54 / DSM 12343) TaxID=177439 RepID=Q6AIT4_DESPS|nr:A24 family peptidase [Desulfotalea psychrophila]CAG37746.1 related to type IV prepilin leader peptidase [Desulfotalea psychrophila LSv54]